MSSMMKSSNYRFLLMIVISFSLFSGALSFVHAEPSTWIVDSSGSGDFRSIQDAISASSDGDMIQINAGVYSENIYIDKKITIFSLANGNVIIDGGDRTSVLSVVSDDVTLLGLTVRNSNDTLSNTSLVNKMSGIYISGDNVTVNDCSITDCYYAVYANDCENVHIEGCSITFNSGGISLNNSLYGYISDCDILSQIIFGVSLQHSNFSTVSYSSISSTSSIGLVMLGSSDNEIYHTMFVNNTYGARLFRSSSLCSNDNMFFNNNFIANDVSAYDECSNQWYFGTIGNYWDDYGGIDSDSDGFGDEPYLIPLIGEDLYPLMEVSSANETIEDMISVFSPTDGMMVNGTLLIRGSVISLNKLEMIMVQVGDADPVDFYVDKNFDIMVNTTLYENGNTLIVLTAVFDGGNTISKELEVIIGNEVASEETNGFTMMLVLASVLIFFLYKRKDL